MGLGDFSSEGISSGHRWGCALSWDVGRGPREPGVGSLVVSTGPGMVAGSDGSFGKDAWMSVEGLQATDVSGLDDGVPRIPMVIGMLALQSERLVGFA